MEELLTWNCEVAIFKNAVPRSTFHPKLYLFEGENNAILIVGSNNLTDGGFFTNYEATRCEFDLPDEQTLYEETLRPLNTFLEPTGRIVQELTAGLIETLVARGEVESEAQVARRRRSAAGHSRRRRAQDTPPNPFEAVPIPFPPLLRPAERQNEASAVTGEDGLEEDERPEDVATHITESLRGVLVWRKALSASDAQQVREGTSPTGGVRLTQAGFENPPGQRIDQTTYFRTMFANYNWEHEERGHDDQEHAFVPMRVVLLGQDLGIHNLEISHKPSGEADQGNYTTILRWGRTLAERVVDQDLTGQFLSLYETTTGDTEFYVEVTQG